MSRTGSKAKIEISNFLVEFCNTMEPKTSEVEIKPTQGQTQDPINKSDSIAQPDMKI